MPRMSVFNSPFLLGFDELERLMDSAHKSAGEGYPPYNIEELADGRIRISLAVAGFKKDDLAITLENNQLLVRGKQVDDANGKAYLHRGIAARQFARQFVLAAGMEVRDAFMENGLLHIELMRPEPQVAKIDISIR